MAIYQKKAVKKTANKTATPKSTSSGMKTATPKRTTGIGFTATSRPITSGSASGMMKKRTATKRAVSSITKPNANKDRYVK